MDIKTINKKSSIKLFTLLVLVTHLNACDTKTQNYSFNNPADPAVVKAPPTTGAAGLIQISNITSSTVSLSWTMATDDFSPQNTLQYRVYFSTTDNIDTIDKVLDNGTGFGGWATNIDNVTVSGLNSNTTYWFNVVVQDQEEKRAAYAMQSATLPIGSPTIGAAGLIQISNITRSTVSLSWAMATDDFSPQNTLQYRVYFSTTDNIDTIDKVLDNGTGFGGWETNIDNVTVNGLNSNTTYWFNVVVQDQEEKKAAYSMQSTTLPMGSWIWISGSNVVDQVGVYGTKGVPSASSAPGARDAAVSWTDGSGNLWLFGGYGYDSGSASTGCLSDLWKFDGTEWTWISGSNTMNQVGAYGTKGLSNASNVPGGRYGSVSWRDSSGNLWLFGGYGFDTASVGYLNDLWKFDGAQWTWVSGSNIVDQKGTYGTKGVTSARNVPGARYAAVSWIDSSGHIWLFGGNGSAGSIGGLNDLWKFNGAQWTWVSGSSTANQASSYGARGITSANNVPGARYDAISWIDASGNFWLFGGKVASSGSYLNDLWKFNGAQWTWVSGSNTDSQVGTYGTKDVPDESNVPGARQGAASWIDGLGNLWLFGGYGFDTASSARLNDLWRVMP